MKILMLGWELPPRNSGGLGVACYHLCQHLANAGVTIDFVMPYKQPTGHEVRFMSIHHTANEDAPFTGAYSYWSEELRRLQNGYMQTVEHLIANATYDAIHAHDWLTFEAGVHAKRRTGKPLVAHVHSTEFDRCGQTIGNPLAHEIEQTALMMADRIIAVSGATKQTLVDRYRLPPHKIDVVYSAADAPAMYAGRPNEYEYLSKMKKHGYKVVVSLGRLTIQKGLTHLLLAAQKALAADPKLLFLVVGDGEQRDELVALSAQLGISQNVVFTGFLRGKAWRDAYAIGDMFVMSSVSEPYGLTALEAAHTGNAVLLTKQSGVSEVLHNALQFDFWDTTKLADYIINVAQNSVLQATLAANAQQEVRQMSWRDTAAELTRIYGQVGSPV